MITFNFYQNPRWAQAYRIRFYKPLIRKNLVIFFVLYCIDCYNLNNMSEYYPLP